MPSNFTLKQLFGSGLTGLGLHPQSQLQPQLLPLGKGLQSCPQPFCIQPPQLLSQPQLGFTAGLG